MLKVPTLYFFLKYEVSKDKTDKLRLSNLNSQRLRLNLFGFKYELRASQFRFEYLFAMPYTRGVVDYLDIFIWTKFTNNIFQVR